MKTLYVRIAGAFAAMLISGSAWAAGAAVPMDAWPDRSKDVASLQSGARLFVNYCLTCHSANLMRWNRLTAIGLTDKEIKDYLIFGNQKVGDTMKIAMTPAEGKAWFGKAPPDLSVIARARTTFDYSGPDYLYTLWRGYYRDASSATGWNNVALNNIAMPHAMWERQGPREATIETIHRHVDEKTGHAAFVKTIKRYDAEGFVSVKEEPLAGPAKEGVTYSFKPADPELARRYDSEVADLVGYLVFMTDPSRSSRTQIGVWVLLFLGVFTVIAWRLNQQYWKDVK
ncbi:MAG: cytochrome c1 [Burkholderiaceae bacterium]